MVFLFIGTVNFLSVFASVGPCARHNRPARLAEPDVRLLPALPSSFHRQPPWLDVLTGSAHERSSIESQSYRPSRGAATCRARHSGVKCIPPTPPHDTVPSSRPPSSY
ncbi:hypothetical protein BJY52DRAFT_1336184 [Lactarius psammicola]|nr:hypothetical protein BJY52DRAFT_1336184 [Lactarius psammicola]